MRLLTYVSRVQDGDVSRAFKKTGFWRACRRALQDFDPLLREVPLNKAPRGDGTVQKPWEVLIQELQALIARLASNSADSTELLDCIETTVQALRMAAAERHRQWIEAFFSQLRARCSENPVLVSMVTDIERLQAGCAQSDLTSGQLIDRLVAIGNVVETSLAQYTAILERIDEKEATLARLSSLIAAASLHERPDLRRAEGACRDELTALRDKLFNLESVLSKTFESGVSDPPTAHPASPVYQDAASPANNPVHLESPRFPSGAEALDGPLRESSEKVIATRLDTPSFPAMPGPANQ